jgi:sugar O-acyltransferase (sialic acid O-acetyltransferase NeuD family)
MSASDAIFLYACGGHGRVVLDAALAAGIKVTAIIDRGLTAGEMVFGVPVLGGDEVLDSAELVGARWLNGMGANPDLTRRREVFETLSPRFELLSVQHPTVIGGRLGPMGKGLQLMAGVVLQNGTRFGDNVVINTGARIDHDCHIGAHSFVAPGATLCGGVTLGERVFIGAAAVIIPGIVIGAGAIVGAGSVVIQDIPAQTVWAGNPAKQMRQAEA